MSDKDGRDDERRGGGRGPSSTGGRQGRDGGGQGRPGGRSEGRSGADGGKPPFKPRSFGTKSHAGRDADGAPKKPRSYGSLSHGQGEGVGEKRSSFGKPRDFSERADTPRPKREGQDRGPRREGQDRGPRREGEYRGPRREGQEPGPRREGEYRGPRREGQEPGPRREGQDRGPRREGRDHGPRAEGRGAPARRSDDRRPAAPEDVGVMRIAKRLARAGVASRRDAEGMIADGRVRVNGTLLDSPALDVGPGDRIEVDGAPLPAIERTRLWLFHKPAGLVTTNRDPEGRATVFDRLPEDMPRVLTVGRLDINTEGLLLLTNDGGLSRTLELPATGWLRRYRVRAHGTVSQEALDELRQGIAIDGVFYGAVDAVLDREQGHNTWLTVSLREGKNREVKRILGHLGLDVNRLIRLSFGPFQLGELAEGAVMEVKGRTLRDQLGERLIEESGANFDAPIVNEFSNKAVQAEKRPAPERRRDEAGGDGEWVTVGDMKRPNRKKADAAFRENSLSRLDTRPRRDERSRGDKPERRERSDKPERRDWSDKPERRERSGEGAEAKRPRGPIAAGRRAANVWMAPGARAVGPKRKEAMDESARTPRDGKPFRAARPPRDDRAPGDGRPARPGFDKRGPKGDGPRGDGPRGSGPRGNGPRGDGPKGGGGSRPGRSGPPRGR